MRPVDKPLPPPQSLLDTGGKKGWSSYRRLQAALVDTIGSYCSFCELPINVDNYIVDKRSPLLGKGARFDDWQHLLLGCFYCQTFRRNVTIDENNYIWPDLDATFTLTATSPFTYHYKTVNYIFLNTTGGLEESGTTELVIVEANQDSTLYQKAQRLIDLFQLNTPAYDARTNTMTVVDGTLGTYPDRRIFFRTEAWQLAAKMIEVVNEALRFPLSTGPYLMALSMMPTIAMTYGFWSVWMTTFWSEYGNEDMIKRLFISTDSRVGYVISGYQGIEHVIPPSGKHRPKRRRVSKSYLFFTGTAKDRIQY